MHLLLGPTGRANVQRWIRLSAVFQTL